MVENYIEKALKEELKIINKHLPYKRTTLKELMKMDIPYIVLRDGTTHLIEKRELELLYRYTGDELASKLRIPIIIEVNPSFGEGAAIIRDQIAAKVLSLILNKEYKEGPLIIYMPHLSELRRILRTTTTVIFIPS